MKCLVAIILCFYVVSAVLGEDLKASPKAEMMASRIEERSPNVGGWQYCVKVC